MAEEIILDLMGEKTLSKQLLTGKEAGGVQGDSFQLVEILGLEIEPLPSSYRQGAYARARVSGSEMFHCPNPPAMRLKPGWTNGGN